MIVRVTRQVTIVANRIKQRFRMRVLEWEHAIITTLWGLTVIFNPAVFAGPSFVAFPGGPSLWGWLVFMLGLARILALGINGYMARPTALVRSISALLGIGLFAALSLGFLFSWTWPTALALYPVIGFFGLFSLFWAVVDVGVPDHHGED